MQETYSRSLLVPYRPSLTSMQCESCRLLFHIALEYRVFGNRLQYGDITLCVCKFRLERNRGREVFDQKPRCYDFLRIALVEDTNGRTLGDNLRSAGILLRERCNTYFKRIVAVGVLCRSLFGCTCGRTDGHIASGRFGRRVEQTGREASVNGLRCEQTVVVPTAQSVYERFVGIVIEEEVIVFVCTCVRRTDLFTQSDEPVCFGVITERNAVGIDFLRSLATFSILLLQFASQPRAESHHQ